MDAVHKTVENFLIDYCEYLPPTVPVLNTIPSASQFLNNYVLPNSPFILKPYGGPFFKEATAAWDISAYLRKSLIENPYITVAVTPNGKADSVVDDKFMVPEERRITFSNYVDLYYKPDQNQVVSVQKQNNNLIEEFSLLRPSLSKDVSWATEAFGKLPEAVNIWMGDERSFTSMHKDHYENIYFVIRGSKTFKLFPPVAVAWMPYKKYPKFQWHFDGLQWQKKDLNEEVNWIRSDLKPETRWKFNLFLNTKSYFVTVKTGECLYLPAMWFHEVSQTKETIAVNYWYDMTYESKFPYYCLVEALAKLHTPCSDVAVDTQTELEDQLVMDLMPVMTKKGFQKKDPSKKKF